MRRPLIFILSFLVLTACGHQRLAEYTSSNHKIDSSIVSNSLDSIISPYRAEMQKKMMQVIGYSDSNLVSYAPESPLSNFVADVVFETGFEYLSRLNAGADQNNTFCMLNFGGIRSAINKGEITTAAIYELMPFDNTIVIVKLSAAKISGLLNAIKASGGQPISNAHVQFGENDERFHIGPDFEYAWTHDVFVITSDYLANGGDKMDFFKNPVDRWDTGILIRDVLMNYIKQQKNIRYTPVQGRIIL